MATLAELISVKDKTAIELLIRCVRNTLWLDIFRYQLEKGLWISSVVLLLAGLINLFFHAILVSVSLTLAVLPIIGGIFVAIKKMPTFANAANHADNLFKGKSLMTTATDLLYANATARQDFSPLIIQQASCKAHLWHQQFKTSAYHKKNQFPWAAIGIVSFGLFFILQSGVPNKYEITKIESTVLKADSKPALITSLINEIRKEDSSLQNEWQSSQNEPTEHFSSSDKQAFSNADPHQLNKKQGQTDDLSSNINKDNSETTLADHSKGAEAVNNQLQALNQHADAGIGTQADTHSSSALYKDAKNRDIKLVDIKLQNGILVSSGGTGSPFKERMVTGSDKPIKLPVGVAFRNTSTVYTPHFSPSQQKYVNAYFKNIPMDK